MFPEKSSADSGPGGAGRGLAFDRGLAELYEAAGGHRVLTLRRLAGLGDGVSTSSLSEWIQGKVVPRKPEHVTYVLTMLIPFLEERAAQRSPSHRRTPDAAWSRALSAAQNVSRSGQGGRGARVHAASRARLLSGVSPALRDVLPLDFVGREGEVGDLAAFVTAPDGAPAYRWYQADPWAGKTGLLAWFVTQELPAGVDVAHYFIAERLGTNRRDGFVQTVGEQLAAAAGSRRRPAVDHMRPDLDPLYETAARACAEKHRRLVLVVDGLDEDGEADLDHLGIAGLLPKNPPHGMRVIVAGRPHPGVPARLAMDHPLRDPGIVRRLADSPAARVIRDAAMTELRALLQDPDIGQRLLGLLATAQGALSSQDLGELLGIRPHVVKEMLRTVAGRSLAPTRTDLLPLDVRAQAETEADRQTFVLAHAELLATARHELGRRFLRERVDDLHHWAKEYQDEGWPEDTPNYLLTGYTRLVQEHKGGDGGRLAALVLDPARQLRISQRSGPDVALRDLDLVAPPDATAPSLQHATEAAVCRELLLSRVQPVPGSVTRTVARLGDARRARALAGASGGAVDKALNLAGVARVLGAMRDKQARDTAREAGKWARTALEEAAGPGWTAGEAEAAAGQVALVLLEMALAPEPGSTGQGTGSGRPGGRVHAGRDEDRQDGLALLRSTRGTGAVRNGAWAQAARLLAPDHPDDARALLDDLEEEAEQLAEEDPAEGSAAAAVELWQTVATADRDRVDRLHDRVLAHATEVWEKAPTLENVSVIAAAASLVARTRPAEAGRLMAVACRWLEDVLEADAGGLSSADAFHAEFGLRRTLAVLSQALADTGTPQDVAARMLELGHGVLPEEHEFEEGNEHEGRSFAEAGRVGEEAFSLADQGSIDEAEQRLQQALALLPMSAASTGRGPVWLPDLAGALIRTDAAAGAQRLLDLVRHPADRARVHAAMALAYGDSHQSAAARRHAQEASRAAACSDTSSGSWAYAAQALACANEVESALDLVARHERPASAGQRAAWRKADRAVRIAVATEIAPLAPAVAGELVLPLLKRLDAAQHAIRSQGLLSSIAELLPVTARLAPEQQMLLDSVTERAQAQEAHRSPQSRQPEDVLVQAFLRIGAGEDPGRQIAWLTQDLAHRGTEYFPTAALAVLHAAVGDLAAVERVAALPAARHHRATVLAAVATHLARVPCRPSPVPYPTGTDPFTRAIQNLALKTTSTTPPDHEAASSVLHRVMPTPAWHHALPALARLVPEAIGPIPSILTTHLHTPEGIAAG
ncbi:hypothetical protein [Streptomyces sp. NPDC013171]|uniref:hypothetical protein n=1 Tax=Streptomyces sp. NPDC013171 TaxID=3364863 RepID=UPI00369BD845